MTFFFPKGATPIDDISGLKLPWVKTLEDLNKVEAENISLAVSKYLLKSIALPQHWFNVATLQKIHRDMLFDVWEWAGKFRTTQTSIGINPYQIRETLEGLCSDVHFWCSETCELTLVEQAARVHHKLVLIHPYPNGNGRFSRLVSDRYLKAWKCPFPTWPTELNKDGQCQKRYIAALKKADKGDHEPLVQYMIEYGAKDPSLIDLLGHTFFRQNFKSKRLILLVKTYIRRGYSINDEKNNGHYPLNFAISHGHTEVAFLLLEAGADFRTRDKSGLSAFELALNSGMYEVAYDMYKRGHPYQPRHPTQQLKVPYQNLYDFDLRYF